MTKEQILVVDDEIDILEIAKYNLSKEGYQIECAETGEEAVRKAFKLKPDLIVLDLMLPGINGLDVCKKLKNDPETANIPIIMATAKGEDIDIVTGLELGADDYVVKPFSQRVLIARIRAILRRKKTPLRNNQNTLQIDNLHIDTGRHIVTVDKKPIDLTATEFAVLYFLANRPGWVFTRNQIIDGVKGGDYPVTERSVDVQIVAIRKKLGETGTKIETVRGVGYRFKDNMDD